tara:strand:- start:81 stop:731 length:651 start_codon:yes stop_codon:yes gene_type:complete
MNIFGEEHPSLWAKESTQKVDKSTVALIVPEGTPGACEFKPMRHKQKLHDDQGYYISSDGRILSISVRVKNRKPVILSPKRSRILDKWNAQSGYYIKPPAVNISVPVGYYDDYEYTAATTGDGYVSKNIVKPNVRFHKVTIETWKPFEQWCHQADPPIPLEDWDKTPASVKKFVLESYYVDHIDADTSNSHVDNLRYCTPIRNSNYRKEKLGNQNG